MVDLITAAKCVRDEYDLVGNIMAYESSGLGGDEIITLFQHLVDTGFAWSLQGHYGRTAHTLIAAGYVQAKSA